MIPTEKQKQAIYYLTDQTTDYIGYGGAAGGGKTALGCFWYMQLGYYAPGTKYFIGRDSLKDSRESVLYTWSEISKKINFTDYKLNDSGIQFKNGSIIELLDLSYYPQKDPLFERFGSKEYTCGWIEEAAQTHPQAFEILKTRVGRWKNKDFNIKSKILCTFNPKKNWVDTIFYRPFIKGLETIDTKFIYALPTDNPYLPEDYIKRLHELKNESTKQRLLFGNFDYDDDPNTMISYDQILNLYTNNHIKGGDKYLIADIARYGSDRAIITIWEGLILIDYLIFDISSTVDIQNAINALRSKHNIWATNCLADEDGVGGGVVDNTHIKGFINNSSPIHKKAYQNLKTECGYMLAETINNIYIKCNLPEAEKDMINQELVQLKTWEADKDNKLRIMPKEEIKDNIGRSPDWLDNFIMRMYFELKQGKIIMHG